jgi:hypothetical protein
MPLSNKVLLNALKQAFLQNDLIVVFERNTTFNLIRSNNTKIISTQLIISSKVNIRRHGSHNGNKTDGIGIYKFILPTGDLIPDYFIMALENMVNGCVEFVIVSYVDLVERLRKRNRLLEDNVEVWLWLMPDRSVHDCTWISIENEWYFISSGINGRMADGTAMDYSGYLNNWEEMKSCMV